MITPPESPLRRDTEGAQMLPSLGRLSVGARTGVNPAVKQRHEPAEEARSNVMNEADLVTAVLEAIKVDDWQTACETAKAWCATDLLRRDTCSKAHGSWRVLNERYFRGSPLNGRWANPIVAFYENCRRATEYKEGDDLLIHEDAGCATFVLEALKHEDMADEWKMAHDALKKDPAFALKVATVNGGILQYVSDHHKRDRAIVLAAVKSQGVAIQYADAQLQQDPEIALAAVTQNGKALRYLSLAYQDQSEYVLVALQSYPSALQSASSRLRKRRDIVLAAVRKNGAELRYAGIDARNAREIVLAAINNYPLALQFASTELRNDREVAMVAVRKNGLALQFAAPNADSDLRVVLTAVRNNPRALQYASADLRDDYDVVMKAVTSQITSGDAALRFASARLRANVDIVRAAVRNDPRAHYWSLEPAASDEVVLRIHNARRSL